MDGNVIRIADKDAPVATKDRILDAAEALFMEHGFEATSLRAITAAAGVNLAAVNYHFGSKEELFQAVLTRRLDPMNQERARPADGARARSRRRRRCPCERSCRRCSSRRCGSRAIRSAAARISCACSAARTPIPRRSSASSCPSSTR